VIRTRVSLDQPVAKATGLNRPLGTFNNQKIKANKSKAKHAKVKSMRAFRTF
jgi:hypothetical protein